ncbi:MAG: TetR/AcrR family transcriptional regulator, partial [Pirellulaceae bacterium]|nr:TetR/AcrR family transcriptional regulator [Pirellulaceae bacterium]
MGVQERRQREFQQREDQILLSARKILANQGYLGLNMDKIADEIEYAKGTVYQHFSCKEEIIIALANETLLKRSEM